MCCVKSEGGMRSIIIILLFFGRHLFLSSSLVLPCEIERKPMMEEISYIGQLTEKRIFMAFLLVTVIIIIIIIVPTQIRATKYIFFFYVVKDILKGAYEG
jgi:hypothetical protein